MFGHNNLQETMILRFLDIISTLFTMYFVAIDMFYTTHSLPGKKYHIQCNNKFNKLKFVDEGLYLFHLRIRE